MVQDIESHSYDELVALSSEMQRAGRYQDLEPVLRRLVSLSPQTVDHSKRLGWLLLERDKPDEAEIVFRKIAGASPQDVAEIACGLGVAALQSQKFDAAIRLLRDSVRRGFASARHSLLKALNAIGRFQEGLEITRRMSEDAPLDPTATLRHSRQLAFAGRHADAASNLVELVQSTSPTAESLDFLAQLLVFQGNFGSASSVLSQRLRQDFENTEMHGLWSYCLQTGYTEDSARHLLLQLIERDPKHAAALFQMALLHDRISAFDQATLFAKRCVTLVPASSLVAGLLGRLELLQGHPDAAADFLSDVWKRRAEDLRKMVHKPPKCSQGGREDVLLNPIIYIPIEISSRELVSRLLIAHFAARAGFIVVILGHAMLRHTAATLPPGILLNKSLSALDAPLAEQASLAGHLLAVIDEEAFGWTGGPFSVTRMLMPENLAHCAALLAPGRHYATQVSEGIPDAKSVVVVTGNPRTDLFEPRFAALFSEEADSLRKMNGPTLLICTNFGGWNCAAFPYSTVCFTALRATGAAMDSERGKWLFDIYRDSAAAECRNTAGIMAAVPALARAFPGYKIVVRPHPVENPGVWANIVGQLPNAVVSNTASLHAQILAADAVIHLAGCGTGLEAILLDRLTVCFNPVAAFEYPKLGLSAQLSPNAHDIPALLEAVAAAVSSGRPHSLTPENRERLADHICRTDRLVSENIVSCLSELFERRLAAETATSRTGGRLMKTLREVVQAGKTQVDANSFGSVGVRSKRLKVTKDEIIEMLTSLKSSLGAPDQLSVDSPVDGVFVIRA